MPEAFGLQLIGKFAMVIAANDPQLSAILQTVYF